jgi:hypothetical protein
MSLAPFIWLVADLLRDYKQSEYGKVILPFNVLRRMDCVLEKTKDAVLAENTARKKTGINPEPFLLRKAKQSFYNTSPMDMKTLMGDQDHIKENLYSYIQAFSPSGRCEKIGFKICRKLGVEKIALGRPISDRWGVGKHLGSKIKSRKLQQINFFTSSGP